MEIFAEKFSKAFNIIEVVSLLALFVKLEKHMNTFFGLAVGNDYVETFCCGSHTSVAQVHQNALVFYCVGPVTY